MQCNDLHINIQDASGDRILAGEKLIKDPTSWMQWITLKGMHHLNAGNGGEEGKAGMDETVTWLGDDNEDVHDYLGAARRSRKKQFPKTPKLGRGVNADACRLYGSLEGNKVQGDFHITARGHGYMEFAEHLSHDGRRILTFLS